MHLQNMGHKILFMKIRRMHLFEFEDLEKFPKLFRNYLTDFLEFLAELHDFYKYTIPLLRKQLKMLNKPSIIDIGSGAGGGIDKIYTSLSQEIKTLEITLTDLYPNITAFKRLSKKSNGRIKYIEYPVSASEVPNDLIGLRTFFRSFHHFEPNLCVKVLKDCIANNQPIGIFDIQQRTVLFFIFYAIISPLLVLLYTPFIKPFSGKRLLFTYIIPVVPFIAFWDGSVTVLRTYNTDELKKMAVSADVKNKYKWESGQIGKGSKTVFYFLGSPKNHLNYH